METRLFAMNGSALSIVQGRSTVIVWCWRRIAWVVVPSLIGQLVRKRAIAGAPLVGPSDVEGPPSYPFGDDWV